MADFLFLAAMAYLAAGICLAPVLSFWLSNFMDASAAHGSRGFRFMILPGLAALWPVMLIKALQARRGVYELPVPEKPASPRALRVWHGRLILILLFVTVSVVLAALHWQVRDYRNLRTAELPKLSKDMEQMAFVPLPVSGKLPMAAGLILGEKQWVIEFEVERDLEMPPLAVYWSSANHAEKLPEDAVLIGSLWGPSRLRYLLPAAARSGTLYIFRLAGDQQVEDTLPLEF